MADKRKTPTWNGERAGMGPVRPSGVPLSPVAPANPAPFGPKQQQGKVEPPQAAQPKTAQEKRILPPKVAQPPAPIWRGDRADEGPVRPSGVPLSPAQSDGPLQVAPEEQRRNESPQAGSSSHPLHASSRVPDLIEESPGVYSLVAGEPSNPSLAQVHPSNSPPQSSSRQPAPGQPAQQEAPSVSFDPLIGVQCAGYTITKVLGVGGMGAVYLAENPSAKTPKIAIKVYQLPKDLQVPIDPSDPVAASIERAKGNIRERFMREASMAMHLDHPNIVKTFEVVELGSRLGYTMEYIEGDSLYQTLYGSKKLPLDQAVMIVRKMCHALALMADKGMVHRDIKPENIMLVKGTGEPKLLDLGLAKPYDEDVPTDHRLTEQGIATGTPEYMSPEAAMGSPTDDRSDQYSLAIVLYELLIGETPYKGINEKVDSPSILARHVYKEAIPLIARDPTIPQDLSDAVSRALQRKNVDRFTTIRDFDEALARCETNFKASGQKITSQGEAVPESVPVVKVPPVLTPVGRVLYRIKSFTGSIPKLRKPLFGKRTRNVVLGLAALGASVPVGLHTYDKISAAQQAKKEAEQVRLDALPYQVEIDSIVPDKAKVKLLEVGPEKNIWESPLGETPIRKMTLSGNRTFLIEAPGYLPTFVKTDRNHPSYSLVLTEDPRK